MNDTRVSRVIVMGFNISTPTILICSIDLSTGSYFNRFMSWEMNFERVSLSTFRWFLFSYIPKGELNSCKEWTTSEWTFVNNVNLSIFLSLTLLLCVSQRQMS